jgi:DNA-binding CsgD family transcriptional regulator
VGPLGNAILHIYRMARERPVDEFQHFVLGIVRSMIPFDSSQWATGEFVGNKMVTRFAHLQDQPDHVVLDWDAASHQDRLMDLMIANPGRAVSMHTPVFFADREVRRYANSLGIAVRASLLRHWETLSLSRVTSEKRYAEVERSWLEQLMPHLMEALEHNRMHGLQSAGIADNRERAASAIARGDGLLSYASRAFMHLLQQEWPDWKGLSLPEVLQACLARPGCSRFDGGTITVDCTRLGQLIFLRASGPDPLRRLSPREALVARLYGEGLAYKQIAKQMDISPTTVRVFLQRVYRKLHISGKAQLATLLATHQGH